MISMIPKIGNMSEIIMSNFRNMMHIICRKLFIKTFGIEFLK